MMFLSMVDYVISFVLPQKTYWTMVPGEVMEPLENFIWQLHIDIVNYFTTCTNLKMLL